MDDRPFVSCIMPTHNRRPFVAQAIRYFLRQDYPQRELIVVDDGAEAVRDLLPDDNRVRYLRLAERHTLGAKRNRACREAQGEIIVHWDDDDWMAAWRLRYQVKQLLAAGVDVCGLDKLYFYDPAGARAWQYVYPRRTRPWLAGGTLCYTKAFWRRNPFPGVNVGEDTRFVWSKPAKKLLALPDNSFYVALIHPGNTSAKRTAGRRWQPHPAGAIHDLMGDDHTFYVPHPVPAPAAPPEKGEADETPVATSPRITVTIPYFRCRKHIRRAVESVLQQTHDNLRLVVVNDGDPNPPWDELAHIDDPRLVRFDLPANRGRYFVDAVVLHATDDPYYLVQDADDWSEPERIETLLRQLRRKHAVAAISACRRWRSDGRRRSGSHVLTYEGLLKPLSKRFEFRSDHHGLFRTDALRAIGGYYGGFRIGYDTLLVNLLLMTGRVAYVKEPLYNRYIRPGSLTTSQDTGMRSRKRRRVRHQLSRLYADAYARYGEYVAGRLDKKGLAEAIRRVCGRHLSAEERREIEAQSERLRAILAGRAPAGAEDGSDLFALLRRVVDHPRLRWDREWTLTRRTAIELARTLCDRRPRRILELGSGQTTAVLARYAATIGAEVVTLEHQPGFRRRTRQLLQTLGLAGHADVRLAPLVPRPCADGASRPWYDGALSGEFDFALIDGPPKAEGRGAALFALSPHLAPDAEVWLHDGNRPHEQECIAGWRAHFSFAGQLWPVDKGVWKLADVHPAGDA